LHIDAKEVMDVTEITHGKLLAEGADGSSEESRCVGGQNDVVDI
jgi:hypothetical protein